MAALTEQNYAAAMAAANGTTRVQRQPWIDDGQTYILLAAPLPSGGPNVPWLLFPNQGKFIWGNPTTDTNDWVIGE